MVDEFATIGGGNSVFDIGEKAGLIFQHPDNGISHRLLGILGWQPPPSGWHPCRHGLEVGPGGAPQSAVLAVRRVRWTIEAAKQFETGVTGIQQDSSDATGELAQLVIEPIEQLATFPGAGRPGQFGYDGNRRPGTWSMPGSEWVRAKPTGRRG